jgi:hypothetical protein
MPAKRSKSPRQRKSPKELTNIQKVRRGLLKSKAELSNARVRRSVLNGRFNTTRGGLKKGSLRVNKRKQVVSIRASSAAKKRYQGSAAQAWSKAVSKYLQSHKGPIPKRGSTGHAAITKDFKSM